METQNRQRSFGPCPFLPPQAAGNPVRRGFRRGSPGRNSREEETMWSHSYPREAARERERRVVLFASHKRTALVFTVLSIILTGLGVQSAAAQALNWEGQTGVFVTPLAYTVPSSDSGISMPVVAYHYLNAGPVLGGFNQASVTVGALGRLEFGYTRDIHQDGSTAGLSNLW